MTTPKKPPTAIPASTRKTVWDESIQAAADRAAKVQLPLSAAAAAPLAPRVTPNAPVYGPAIASIPLLPGKQGVSAEAFAAGRIAEDKKNAPKAKVEQKDLLAAPMSAQSIEEVLKGLRDMTTYKPNVLQQYDNTAYHFRLFMTPDRDVINALLGAGKTPETVGEYYKMLDRFEQVTIAETGVTGYNIQSVQIESLVGPNFRSVALNTTSLIMNIIEANGVSFLDSLKNAAIQMQVRDVRKVWYYLELTFKGYKDGLTQENVLSSDSLPNGGRWIWQVQVTDIETKLSTAGGNYKLTMVPYSETSLDAEARLLPDMMIAEGSTVGEFFDDLAARLNESWTLRTASPSYLAYDFKFHGMKGRPNITGDVVKDFSLITNDNSLDYIRHYDMGSQGANIGATGTDGNAPTPEEIAASNTKLVLANGQRASTEQLIAMVKSIIPGVRINSGRRTAEHNREVGGVLGSQHVAGTAIDIPRQRMTPSALRAEFAKRGVLVDVIDEPARNHYHIQGSRLHTNSGPVAPTQTSNKTDDNTVAAPPPAADSIPISPLSGMPRGQFARGTSIDEIVTTVFSCCVEAQQMAKDSMADDSSADDSAGDGATEGKVNDKGFRESVVFRVEPEVRVLLYDPAFNQYGKSITYHVYGYVTQTPILSRTQITTANKPEVQKAMLASIAKQGLLRKKYDYLFTGNNLEILDLDISFNMAWAAVLPLLLRNEAYTAQSRYGKDVIDKYTAATDIIASSQQIEEARQEARMALDDANLTLTQATDEQSIADAKKAAEDLQKKLATLEQEGVLANQKISQLRKRLSENIPKIDNAVALSGARIYAENIDSTKLPTLQDISIAMKYAQDDVKNSISGGMVGQYHNGRTIYGTIMNQLEGPMTAQMMTLNMKILGDPYWIGPANMEQTIRRVQQLESETSVDFTIGDNALTLEFGYPLGHDTSDNIKIKRSETFTGVYRVTKVSHDFSEGKFTQTIEGVRMPLIDLFKATANTGTDTK
jgi:hypothetical protein